MQVSNFGHFLASRTGVDLYADRLVREYIRHVLVSLSSITLTVQGC